jgi:hypothetical protein
MGLIWEIFGKYFANARGISSFETADEDSTEVSKCPHDLP